MYSFGFFWYLLVSIHAPVWVRPICRLFAQPTVKFQFTHPCGCDRAGCKRWNPPGGFNSRTRVGATCRFGVNDSVVGSFNSRTRVGATRAAAQAFPPCSCFNSRTRVGATGRGIMWIPITGFQFTHPCGCDGASPVGAGVSGSFNTRTRVGASTHLDRTETA